MWMMDKSALFKMEYNTILWDGDESKHSIFCEKIAHMRNSEWMLMNGNSVLANVIVKGE